MSLGRQFKHLLSTMGFLPVMTSSSQTDQHADHLSPSEDIILLLRCCTTILQLPEFDHSIVLENCKVLLAILKELCSMELLLCLSCQKVHGADGIIYFKKLVSHNCKYTDDGSISSVKEELDAFIHFTKQAGSPVALLCTMLEVFADELLAHHHLRKYLVRTELFSSTREKPVGLVCQSSSYMVATNFKMIQSLYICNGRKCLSHATSREKNLPFSVQTLDDPNKTSESSPYIGDAVESEGEAEADMCDGEIFLELLAVPSDSIEELADFVVCKRNKDYSSRLMQREMFRK